MYKKRRKFDKEFKQKAIDMVVRDGLTQTEVGRRLGITDGMVGKWMATARADGASTFPGNGKLNPEDEEIRRLEKLVRDQQLEIDFLKKTSSYFASLKR